MLSSERNDRLLMLVFIAVVLCAPIIFAPIGAGYPDLLQKFAIYGIFAIGFNILFGLTGYLSFGHAAFLGVGSYATVWSFKLFTMNVVPAMALSIGIAGFFALVIGFISLRRSGIYFSILTLAFAQMCYSLAYSVLTPITNGETGLQVRALAKADESRSLLDADIRVVDSFFGVSETSVPISNFFGLKMSGWEGFYFCAILLIIAFYISLRIFRSDFGLMLRAIKSNQNRLNYTGINTRPYLIVAFVISGMYAGLAGSLLAVTDPLAGAERMQWTESGLVVLMTILGGVGTLIGPLIGAGLIKYLEQIFSSINEQILEATFSFLPETLQHIFVGLTSLFVGEGWELTLGLMFMIVVIFVPGGIMEIISRLIGLFRKKPKDDKPLAGEAQPAE